MLSCAEFLSLTHPRESMHWALDVTAKLTGGRGSLFGGVGLAAGVVALQQATGKPVIWATGQYLSITQQPVTIDLEVLLPAVGRNVTQGRVVGHVGEREIITVLGALGQRPQPVGGTWVTRPEVPPPEDCAEIARHMDGDNLHHHVELRLASGMFGFSGQGTPREDGRSLLWARMRDVDHDAGALAIIADYMPSVLGSALGRVAHCTSLDNTIRYGTLVDTDWVLCDNRMEFVGDGFGYGTVHLWSRDGTLLATASQSVIVRVPEA
ncbi:MAG TPA: thioesterase family protein [Pseudomonadales bacterium]|nr:thioesterase family protein [Pseudomonadales bacterium]